MSRAHLSFLKEFFFPLPSAWMRYVGVSLIQPRLPRCAMSASMQWAWDLSLIMVEPLKSNVHAWPIKAGYCWCRKRLHMPKYHQHQNVYNTKRNPARSEFRKNYQKIFSSVDPESGHSCPVWFLCNIHATPRGAHGSYKTKIGAATNSRKNYKKNYKKKREGN